MLGCGAALIGGCTKSKGSGSDGGADHPDQDVSTTGMDAGADVSDVRVSFDVAVDVGTADAPADVRDAPAATDVRDAGASSDVRDTRPFVDPVDGSTGCPDGGFPAGRGPCQIELPLYGGLNYTLTDGACTYPEWSRLWFSSSGVEVHIDLTSPIVPGAVGNSLAASVWINTNPMDFASEQKIWSTPSGACTVTLHGNVCWYWDNRPYQIVSGRGTCAADAVAAKPDGGAPVTIGDFWFAEVLRPM